MAVCSSMTQPEHKSLRYKWDQFDYHELVNIYCRLRRELNLAPVMATMITQDRGRLEDQINWLTVQKGQQVFQQQPHTL